MPRRETRYDIERALTEQQRKQRLAGVDLEAAMIAKMRQKLAKLRDGMDSAQFVRIEESFHAAVRTLGLGVRRRRRRPGDGSMPALVEPPRGPRPLSGGATAPLLFD